MKWERERQIPYINTYIWNLERLYQRSYVQGSKEDTDVKNRLLDSVGGEGGMFWEKIALKHIHSVESLSHVQLFVTPWTAACQASLSITNSWSLLKLMHIELVMPSNHLIPFSSCLQSFPASGSFPMSQIFTSDGQSIGTSASASVLPMNIEDWFPLGRTGLISLPGMNRATGRKSTYCSCWDLRLALILTTTLLEVFFSSHF